MECGCDLARQVVAVLFVEEFVSGAWDGEDFGPGGNERERSGQLVEGGEAIAGAVNKQGRCLEAREVDGAEFGGALRRVERVGEEKEAIDQAGFGGGKHRGLAAAVGMATEEDAACGLPAHRRDGGFEALLVPLRTAAGRWTLRTGLAKGQIATEDGPSGVAEGRGEGDEERRVRVGSGTVGEDEGIAGGNGREMEEAADGESVGRIVVEGFDVAHNRTVVDWTGNGRQVQV